jgi:hypothetical protein
VVPINDDDDDDDDDDDNNNNNNNNNALYCLQKFRVMAFQAYMPY